MVVRFIVGWPSSFYSCHLFCYHSCLFKCANQLLQMLLYVIKAVQVGQAVILATIML